MKSEEIKKLLELKEYLLEYKEFMAIFENSQQIDSIEYLPNEDKMHFSTNDNYDFRCKIYRKD